MNLWHLRRPLLVRGTVPATEDALSLTVYLGPLTLNWPRGLRPPHWTIGASGRWAGRVRFALLSRTSKMHRQVRISDGERTADVDQGLADVLLALWHAGLRTEWSCQGRDDEPGYIVFESAQDAARFDSLVEGRGVAFVEPYGAEPATRRFPPDAVGDIFKAVAI